MKNVVRNDLWMVIIAWCLLLNNYSLLGMVTGILASLYLSINTRYKNYWRILAVTLVSFSLSFLLARLTVIHLFSYFTFFCGIISFNVAMLNERLHKERLATLYPIFVVMFICLIIFMLVAFIIPTNLVLANAKANLFGLIILVFIPYTSEILISLIVKEYNIKKFLDKQKSLHNPKMYN